MAEQCLHRGGRVCPDSSNPLSPRWELRITSRCLQEDLGLSALCSFEDAEAAPIVKAMVTKRKLNPRGPKTVGPAAEEQTLHHLGVGDDHRGATWYEPDLGVVWLCAYRLHRSKSDDDFFTWIKPLIASGDVYPTEDDRLTARREQVLRFRDIAPFHAQDLVEQAKREGSIVPGVLAWTVPVRVCVEGEGDEGLVYVSVPVAHAARLNEVVAAFDPAPQMTPDWLEAMPMGTKQEAEIVFVLLRQVSS